MYILYSFQVEIELNGSLVSEYFPPSVGSVESVHSESDSRVHDGEGAVERGTYTYTVHQLAYTRSGDKGDNCNIGTSVCGSSQSRSLAYRKLISQMVSVGLLHRSGVLRVSYV